MNDPTTRGSDTLCRRLANAAVRLAARLMPRPLERWADGMRSEVAHVGDDREALRWAIGCVGAASVARFRTLYLLDVPAVRLIGALLAAFLAFDAMFPAALTIAYRARALRLTERLGRMTPGDDYQRLVRLMEAIPAWLCALSVAAGTCYLLAIIFLLGRRRAAHLALLAGVSLGLAATILGRPIIAEVGVRAVPSPSLLSAVLLPIVLPLLVALAALSGSRQEFGMPPQVGPHERTDGDDA